MLGAQKYAEIEHRLWGKANRYAATHVQHKSNVVAFNLCFFLGIFGVYRFYLEKTKSLIAMLIMAVSAAILFFQQQLNVCILLGIVYVAWYVVDLLLLAFGKMTDGLGKAVTWNPLQGLPAGFWRRFSAIIIDGWIISLLAWPVTLAILNWLGMHSELILKLPRVALLVFQEHPKYLVDVIGCLASMFVDFIYSSILIATPLQATFGKRLAGVYIGKEDGSRISIFRSAWRYIARIFSACTLVGFYMAGWTTRKRALHDYLAGTYAFQGKPQ